MFSIKIDTTNFMKAREVWNAHSKRSAPENLNRAVYFVVDRAQDLTKFVSQGTIDTKLNVSTSAKVTKSGNLVTKGRTILPHNYNFAAGKTMVPLAALIVQAQVLRVDTKGSQPGMSRINRSTGMRYARMSSPWRGVSRRTGATRMLAAVSRMVKAGHSSTHFFQASWRNIKRMLLPHMGKGYGVRGGPALDNELSIATPAIPGSSIATCIIENKLGEFGKNPALDASRTIAANRILGGALQKAIDIEFMRSMEEFNKKGWNTIAPKLAGYGIMMT